jgi:hypothetical protein
MFELGLYAPPFTRHVESRGGHYQTELVRQYRGAEVIEIRRIVLRQEPRRRVRTAARWMWRRWLELTPVRRFREWREWRAIQRGEPINWPDRMRPFEKK